MGGEEKEGFREASIEGGKESITSLPPLHSSRSGAIIVRSPPQCTTGSSRREQKFAHPLEPGAVGASVLSAFWIRLER